LPQTPDEFPGEAIQESLLLEDEGLGLAVTPGQMRYSGGRFTMFDSVGEFDPRTGGGITEPQHEALDTLAHEIVEDSFDEVTYTGTRITNVTTWTDVTKTTKVREQQISYTLGRVSQIIDIQYDAAGVETYRVTEDITYAFPFGNRVASITRTRTP
jgi:hypothetical protein